MRVAGVEREEARALNRETAVTFVIVSHNPAIAESGDRVVQLSHGRLADSPAPPPDTAS